MKIGVMYSGVTENNGADYVAEFLGNAVLVEGHELTYIGSMGGVQAQEMPLGLDVVISSAGFGLTPSLVERFRKRCKFFVWTHNDEIPHWQERIGRITKLVDRHFSYTKTHGYGDHVEYLPLAADPMTYFQISRCKKRYDIAMIGAAHPWRVRFAQEISRFFPNCRFSFSMSMSDREINLLYNQTRVMIAPMQDGDQYNPSLVFGCPCRTFDVPATGAFQIQAYREGLKDIHGANFIAETTLPSSSNIEQVILEWAEKIRFYLENEAQREKLAEKSYEDVIHKHLYTHRLEHMLKFI